MPPEAVSLPCRENGEHGCRLTEMNYAAVIGGNMLVAARARTEMVAEFVIGSTEPARRVLRPVQHPDAALVEPSAAGAAAKAPVTLSSLTTPFCLMSPDGGHPIPTPEAEGSLEITAHEGVLDLCCLGEQVEELLPASRDDCRLLARIYLAVHLRPTFNSLIPSSRSRQRVAWRSSAEGLERCQAAVDVGP